MDFLSWLWTGSDGPRMRHLRQWLEARGYRLVSKTRPGIMRTWVFEGRALAIQLDVDRATDWYVGVAAHEGGTEFYDLADWVCCVTKTVSRGDYIRLPEVDVALRLHLESIEAACAADRLPATIECLSGR